MVDRFGDTNEQRRREQEQRRRQENESEKTAHERTSQRPEPPWRGLESESARRTAGGPATPGRPGEQGREEISRAGEQAREEIGRAVEQGREAARERAESLFHSGSERAARWVERASEALREGATKLEGDDEVRRAAPLVRRAASGLDRFAETLRSDDLDTLMHRVERFARRRPVAFLGGAAAAGAMVGRFLRSSGARRQGGLSPGATQTTQSQQVGSAPHIQGPHAPPIAVSPTGIQSETETESSRRNS
jgi:hypothetical protein